MTVAHLPQHWRYRLLRVLEVPETVDVLRFLLAWAQAEGGTSNHNPLNTTYPLPWGSTDHNSVHVKNYATPLEGIAATALTLDEEKFQPIVGAMRTGDTAEKIVSLCSDTLKLWGTDPHTILEILKTM